MNKCFKCDEDATRTDLYFIWQKSNFKGVAEIGICNDCINPYLPRKILKLLGAILISILLIVVVVAAGSGAYTDWTWWNIIMMFGAAYQAYQWFSDFANSSNLQQIEVNLLQTKLGEIVDIYKRIDNNIIINWQVFQLIQKLTKVNISNFTNPDFLTFIRKPISLDNSLPVELKLIPESFNSLPAYFNNEDKELLKESVNLFRQEKTNALKEKYLKNYRKTESVVFVREDKNNTGTFLTYQAPCKADAMAFLSAQHISQPSYYVVVETPEGNYGKDIQGIYIE